MLVNICVFRLHNNQHKKQSSGPCSADQTSAVVSVAAMSPRKTQSTSGTGRQRSMTSPAARLVGGQSATPPPVVAAEHQQPRAPVAPGGGGGQIQGHGIAAVAAGPGAAGAAAMDPVGIAGANVSDDDSGCGIEEFTWVPAGLTPAQVCLHRHHHDHEVACSNPHF